jgi:hypothetical protein
VREVSIPTTSTTNAATRISQSSLLTRIPPPTAAAIRMIKSSASSSDMVQCFPPRLAVKPLNRLARRGRVAGVHRRSFSPTAKVGHVWWRSESGKSVPMLFLVPAAKTQAPDEEKLRDWATRLRIPQRLAFPWDCALGP